MCTVDGSRGSAKKLLNVMIQNETKAYLKKQISEALQAKIKADNEHKLYRKVFLKYVIMRIRAKISFTAME